MNPVRELGWRDTTSRTPDILGVVHEGDGWSSSDAKLVSKTRILTSVNSNNGDLVTELRSHCIYRCGNTLTRLTIGLGKLNEGH